MDLSPGRWARPRVVRHRRGSRTAATPTACASSSSASSWCCWPCASRGSASAPRCWHSAPPGCPCAGCRSTPGPRWSPPPCGWSPCRSSPVSSSSPTSTSGTAAAAASSAAAVRSPSTAASPGRSASPPCTPSPSPCSASPARSSPCSPAPGTSSTAPPCSSSARSACSPWVPGPCRPSAPTPTPGSTRRRGSRCPSPSLLPVLGIVGLWGLTAKNGRPKLASPPLYASASVLMLLARPGHRCPAGDRADRDPGRRRRRPALRHLRHHVGGLVRGAGRRHRRLRWGRVLGTQDPGTAGPRGRRPPRCAPAAGRHPRVGPPGPRVRVPGPARLPRHPVAGQHGHHRGAQHGVGDRRLRARPRLRRLPAARARRAPVEGAARRRPWSGHTLEWATSSPPPGRQLRGPPRDRVRGAALRRGPPSRAKRRGEAHQAPA